MKYLLPALVLLAMVESGHPAWESSRLPVSLPGILTRELSYPTLSFKGLGAATGVMPAPELPLPLERFPGATFETTADAILLPQPLDLSSLDVGIDLFVQESAEGPSSVFGIGLVLDFQNP